MRILFSLFKYGFSQHLCTIFKFYHINAEKSLIKISKIKTIDKTALEYGICWSTLKEWIKSYKLLGEEGLKYGNGIRAKKTKRTSRPKSLNFNKMTKQELIEYIEVINDIKKCLEKSTKKEVLCDFLLEEKISD